MFIYTFCLYMGGVERVNTEWNCGCSSSCFCSCSRIKNCSAAVDHSVPEGRKPHHQTLLGIHTHTCILSHTHTHTHTHTCILSHTHTHTHTHMHTQPHTHTHTCILSHTHTHTHTHCVTCVLWTNVCVLVIQSSRQCLTVQLLRQTMLK